MSRPFDRGRGKGILFSRLVCVSIAILLSVSMLTLAVGQVSAKPVCHPDPVDPLAKGDPVRYTYSRGDITATYRLLDGQSIEEMKETIGVREPGVDYNLLVDSMGTGLAPPSEDEWTAMEGEVKVVDSVESKVGTASSFDLSTEPYFPQVRSQGSQGSCAAWAMTYYAYGYLEAKANGWTEAKAGNNSQLISPAWTYNKVNGGSDGGSSMQRNGQIIVEWGAATWATMPYNQHDAVSWGNEAAWREAPLHRAVDVYSISFNPSTTVDTVKNLVASGVPITFAIDAYQYSNAFSDGNYIVSSSEYSSNTVNHANTIVGFDDTISDDGDVGAFRVVNSWGSNWGDNGFYWLTYSAFNEIGNLLFLRYIETRVDYTPSLLAVWHFNDAPTRDADFQVGIGTASSPLDVREPYYGKNTGTNTHRFPTFMCLDISEFQEEYDGGASSFYLLFGSATYAGTISSFKLEMYETPYSPGFPTQVFAQSPDVPKATPGHVNNQLSYYPPISLATALDNQNLSPSTGGPAAWVGVTDMAAYGGDAARSGDVGDSGTSWMKLDIPGPAEIEFRWKVSSEEGKDLLRFNVNGMEKASISGQTSWATLSFEIGQGMNTVEWRYTKDGSNSVGQDCGWVDRIVISGVSNTLRIDGDAELAQAASSKGWAGSGTSSDPYIIEGLSVNAIGLGSGIFIGNTTAHLVIRNSMFMNASFVEDPYAPGAGIFLHNALNVIIENNTCSGNDIGIALFSADSNLIIRNTVVENGKGIYLSGSDSNRIADNLIRDSVGYGIALHSGGDNLVWRNILEGNSGSGSSFDQERIQAYDDSTGNAWSWEGIGNHYGDWKSPDSDGDWVVDVGYQLAGSSQTDGHPLVHYLSPPYDLKVEGEESAVLRWELSTYSLHGKVIEHRIFKKGSSGTVDLAGTTPGDVDSFALNDGASSEGATYFVQARSDLADSAPSNEVVVDLLDDTPPSVTITSPAQNSWKGTSTVTVEWIGSDSGSGIDRFEISRDDESFIDLGTSQSYTYSSLSNGLHDVVVRAFDKAGNVAEDSVTFGVDTVAPSLTINSPSQGQILSSNSVIVTWQGSDSTSGIAYYQVRLDSGSWINVGSATSYTFSSVADGQHVSYVRAVDNAGNAIIKSRSLVVDTCEPAVEITAPSGGESGCYLSQSEVQISWIASDAGTGISQFEIRLNSGQWVNIGGVLSHTYGGLSEGQHTVTVRAYDLAGNTGSDSIAFTVDTVSPDLTILSPLNNSILATSSVTLEWVGSDATSGLSGYDVRLDSGDWIYVGLSSSHTFNSLSQGAHTLTVRATDAAGNVAVKSVSITVDSIPPTVSITSPEDDSYINQTSVEVTWEGSDSGTGISNYWIRLNSGDWIDVGKSPSYQLTVTNGEHLINVKAKDGAGNNAFDTVRIVVDDRPLWVYITIPQNGTAVGDSSPIIKWKGSSSGFGISHYEIRLNEGQWEQVGLLTSYQLSGLQEGTHVVQVRIVDNSGSASEDRIEFMVDTTPPWLRVIEPSDGTFVGSSVVVKLEAADDGSGLLECLVSLDGGEWAPVGEDLTYTLIGLSEGEHSIVARAVDRVGNWIEESVTFIVDLTPPTVSILSPAHGQVTNQSYVSLSWNASDSLSGVDRCEFKLNDGSWISIPSSGSMSITQLESGQHTMYLRAVDGAGNFHTASVSFLVDTGESLVVLFLDPLDGESLGSDEMKLEWSSQSGPSGVIGYGISVNGGEWIDMGVLTSTTLNLGEGAHEIWLRAIDAAGNVAMASVNVTVDLSPPDISWTTVTGPYVNMSQSELGWNGSDDLTDIDRFELWVNGALVLSGTETSFPLETLPDGEHHLLLRAYDLVGNMAEITLSLHLDTTSPDLIMEQGSEVITNRTSIELGWIGIDEGSGILSYEIRIGNGEWISLGLATGYILEFEGEGVYTVQVKCADRAGNAAIEMIEITVDWTVPTVVQHSPGERSPMSLEEISVIFSEEMDSETLEVTVEGAIGYYTYHHRELLFVLTMPLIPGTTCTVTVQGDDLAGNSLETFTWSFNVEYEVTLKGLVVDSAGVPVAGATVILSDGQSCLTAPDGGFAIDVTPGAYEVTVIMEGFKTLSLSISIDGPSAHDLGELILVQEDESLLEMLVEPPVIVLMAAGMVSLIGMAAYVRRQ